MKIFFTYATQERLNAQRLIGHQREHEYVLQQQQQKQQQQ